MAGVELLPQQKRNHGQIMKMKSSNDNNIVADKLMRYGIVRYMDKDLVYLDRYVEMDTDSDGLCLWQTLCYQRNE